MVAAMDKVGVDGAIFISAFSMYRYDASYAVEVQRSQSRQIHHPPSRHYGLGSVNGSSRGASG
jgi:hypothetical protein